MSGNKKKRAATPKELEHFFARIDKNINNHRVLQAARTRAKVMNRSEWDAAIKAIKAGKTHLQNTLTKMNQTKITSNNTHEIFEKALTLENNVEIYFKKIAELEHSKIKHESEAEMAKHFAELKDIKKEIENLDHPKALRKFLISEVVFKLQEQSSELQTNLQSVIHSKKFESHKKFSEQAETLITSVNQLEKELAEFGIDLYNSAIQNILKIANDVKNAVAPLSSEQVAAPPRKASIKPELDTIPEETEKSYSTSTVRITGDENDFGPIFEVKQSTENSTPTAAEIKTKKATEEQPKATPTMLHQAPSKKVNKPSTTTSEPWLQKYIPINQNKKEDGKSWVQPKTAFEMVIDTLAGADIKQPEAFKKIYQHEIQPYKNAPKGFKQCISIAADIGTLQAYRLESMNRTGTWSATSEDASRKLKETLRQVYLTVAKEERELNEQELNKLSNAYETAKKEIKENYKYTVKQSKANVVLNVIEDKIKDIKNWQNAPAKSKPQQKL